MESRVFVGFNKVLDGCYASKARVWFLSHFTSLEFFEYSLPFAERIVNRFDYFRAFV